MNIFNDSHDIIKVTGSDRTIFLHRLLTQDIKDLPSGSVTSTAFLNATSHVLGLMAIMIQEDHILLIADENFGDLLIEKLSRFVITEDISFSNISSSYKTFSYLRDSHTFPKNSFINFQQPHKNGFSYILVKADQENDWTKFLESHAIDISNNLEMIRIENGVLKYGQDIDEKVMLSETVLEKITASETKGCYPGQEVVAKIETYGRLNRRVSYIFWEGKNNYLSDCQIYDLENRKIGWLTKSQTYSEKYKKNMGFGYLSKSYYEEESEVILRSQDIEISAWSKPWDRNIEIK